MATKFGLTPAGFVLPPLGDLIADTKQSLIQTFGETFNTESNSIVDKLTTILNEREYQVILLAASVYAAQTLNGAEGIYLDELLSRRGIYRSDAIPAFGNVQLCINSTVPYNLTYSKSVYTFGNGLFRLSQDTTVAGSIVGHTILNRDLKVGEYSFQVQNQSTGIQKTLKLTLTNKSVGSPELSSFFNSIKNFIIENTSELNDNVIFIDSVNGSLYIGYNSNLDFTGLNSKLDFRVSPVTGNRIIEMGLTAIEPGTLSREPSTVKDMSPTPAGFVSLDNKNEFTPGRDIESDIEYKARASLITPESSAATRPSVVSAILSVDGVQKVKIFSNPTPETSEEGVPPYKFEAVVYGGATEDISKAIYKTIALSNATYGEVFSDIDTEDNQVERVYHSKAKVKNLSMRIKYKGNQLASSEILKAQTSVRNMIDTLNIADTLYNIQLLGVIGQAITLGRFTQLIAEVKDLNEPETAYSNADLMAESKEVFFIDPNNIEFERIF